MSSTQDKPEVSETVTLKVSARQVWDKAVRKAGKNLCANCGAQDHLKACLIVPEESGGELKPSNGVLLCRGCELRAGPRGLTAQPAGPKRPINFWLSRQLYDQLQVGANLTVFKSCGGLVRFLMTQYTLRPQDFEDLALHQPPSDADVKVNIWVDYDLYAKFRVCIEKQNVSVSAALRSLIVIFENETYRFR